MLRKLGPPKNLEEQFAQVINSFKLSDGKLLVFLKWKNSKLPNGTFLDNLEGNTWVVKSYLWITRSFVSYEKTIEEKKNNIFQYLLESINTNEKPSINTFLKSKQPLIRILPNGGLTIHPGRQ